MTADREQQLLSEIALLRAENELLREKVSEILRRLYDKKSETLDSAQLELLLDPDAAKKASAADPADPGPAAETPVTKKRGPRKPRDISHLPVRETRLIPDEVKANPDAYREIDRASTDRFRGDFANDMART